LLDYYKDIRDRRENVKQFSGRRIKAMICYLKNCRKKRTRSTWIYNNVYTNFNGKHFLGGFGRRKGDI